MATYTGTSTNRALGVATSNADIDGGKIENTPIGQTTAGPVGASTFVATSETIGTSNVTGISRNTGLSTKAQTVTAMTTSATITTAALLGGLITGAQGAGATATYTMPTGAVLGPALPAGFATNDSFDFTIVNISTTSAEIITVAGASGMTAVGNVTVAANNSTTTISSATFRIVQSAANTFSFYRVS